MNAEMGNTHLTCHVHDVPRSSIATLWLPYHRSLHPTLLFHESYGARVRNIGSLPLDRALPCREMLSRVRMRAEADAYTDLQVGL